jgi:hypothetical protein
VSSATSEAEKFAAEKQAYKWTGYLAVIIILILIVGIVLAFILSNFAIVPFSVVIMGIVAFFGVLRISRALPVPGDDQKSSAEMRKAITVSILVTYLGLLPTLAFQGILQFQVTGNKTADVALLNQTVNQTAVQVVPQAISLSETVVTSFTALVTAVLLFYFGSRTLENIKNGKGSGDGKTDESPGTSVDSGESTGTGNETNLLDEIKKVKELFDSNIITEEDFNELKNELKKNYLDKL